MKNNYIRKEEPVKGIPFWAYLMAIVVAIIMACHVLGWIEVTNVNPIP